MSSIPSAVRNPFTFDRVVRIFFSVVVVAAVLFLLKFLKGVLLPFVVACLIAYLLEPVVRWNMKKTKSKKRWFPVTLTLLEATAVVVGAGWVLIPYIISETSQMAVMLRHYTSTQIDIPYVSGEIHQFLRDNIDFDEISNLLTREQWVDLAKQTLSSGWQVVSSGMAWILGALSWMVTLLYVVFIMLDYDRIQLGLKKLIPYRHRDSVLSVVHDIESAMNRYFRGQVLIAAIVGCLFAMGFMFVGLPLAIFFGLFIGILNLVPYLQLLSLPVAVLLCLVETASSGTGFWTILMQTMAVYIIVQTIQDMILTPRIMGKAMGLNPALVLLSLSIWGTLLGFMGLLIGLPLTTLLLSYYMKYVSNPSNQ